MRFLNLAGVLIAAALFVGCSNKSSKSDADSSAVSSADGVNKNRPGRRNNHNRAMKWSCNVYRGDVRVYSSWSPKRELAESQARASCERSDKECKVDCYQR